MAFWTKKTPPTIQKEQAIHPNIPLIEALGRINVSFRDISTRAEYARTFTEVSEVYSVITYIAKAFSNMKLRLYINQGEENEEIEQHELLNKLNNPNPLNNWTDFLINYMINKKVFGNAYIYKYMPAGFDDFRKMNLWVLPSQYIYPAPAPVKIGTYYNGLTKDEYVRGYTFFNRINYNQQVNWSGDDILHQKEPRLYYSHKSFLEDIIEGESPLRSLKEPITNIRKAYEAQNVILQKRGALGMITPKNAKDQVGAVSLLAKDKQDLHDQFGKYGLGSEDWQFIISNVEMDYKQMSIPIRELMLLEGIESSMKAICNTYNFPILLLNYLQGSTYSNLNELKKSLYQDNIIPEARAFMRQFNSFLGLPKKGLLLKADFDHIPILQQDAKLEAEKDAIEINSILRIQEQISNGSLLLENGINILSHILSYPREQIVMFLNDKKNTANEYTDIQ